LGVLRLWAFEGFGLLKALGNKPQPGLYTWNYAAIGKGRKNVVQFFL
jgi:hypothetical protein